MKKECFEIFTENYFYVIRVLISIQLYCERSVAIHSKKWIATLFTCKDRVAKFGFSLSPSEHWTVLSYKCDLQSGFFELELISI